MKKQKLVAVGLAVILLSFGIGVQQGFSWEGAISSWTPGYFEEARINATTEFYRAGANYTAWIDDTYLLDDGSETIDISGTFSATDINATSEIYRGGSNYTALVESLIASGVSGATAWVVPDFFIIKSGGTYVAYNRSGSAVYSNAKLQPVWTSCEGDLTSGGVLQLGVFDASAETATFTYTNNGVWTRGSGINSTVITLTANSDTLFDIGTDYSKISDMKLKSTAAYDDTTMIEWSPTYGTIENMFLGTCDFGLNYTKVGTSDNWVDTLYILDFEYIGAQLEWSGDTHYSTITIGTSRAEGNALACIVYDEGGAGDHWDGVHLWADTTCQYGLLMGNEAGTYQYGAQFDNLEIEDSGIQVGIHTTVNADYNIFTNLKMKAVITGVQEYGDYNQYCDFELRNLGENAFEVYSDNTNIGPGLLHAAGKDGLSITSTYGIFKNTNIHDVLFSSNGQDGADTYYDIHLTHVKNISIHGGGSMGTDTLYSIYVDDCDYTTIRDFDAWDEEIIFNSAGATEQVTNCWNASAWVATGP